MEKRLKCVVLMTCFSIIVMCLTYLNITSLQLDTARLNNSIARLLLQSKENQHSLCHNQKKGNKYDTTRDIIELKKLRDLVQRRLFYIQNPKNCKAAKKIICEPNKALRNVFDKQAISLPGMAGFEMPDYMPFAIPADLADRLEAVHINPEVWWIGQFVEYLIRPNNDLKLHLREQQNKLVFRRPLIGLHIRRTDKLMDTRYFNLSEYMDVVDQWFKKHLHNNTQTRYIFIATDSPSVLQEAMRTYQNYTFVYHKKATTDKYSLSALKDIISDIHTLRMCDFVACTMSSNICRLVNELKGSIDGCAAYRLVSLDMDYFFHAIEMRRKKRTPLQNIIASHHGLKPIKDKTDYPKRILLTTDRNKSRVVMPIYPELTDTPGQ